jgi:hypothetical protein
MDTEADYFDSRKSGSPARKHPARPTVKHPRLVGFSQIKIIKAHSHVFTIPEAYHPKAHSNLTIIGRFSNDSMMIMNHDVLKGVKITQI